MTHIKTFESYDSDKKLVVCDESVYPLVTSKFKDATIYQRNSNSGVISTLKTLVSNEHTDITYVIDDVSKISADKRLNFIEEYMGQDFKKINVIKSSEL